MLNLPTSVVAFFSFSNDLLALLSFSVVIMIDFAVFLYLSIFVEGNMTLPFHLNMHVLSLPHYLNVMLNFHGRPNKIDSHSYQLPHKALQ